MTPDVNVLVAAARLEHPHHRVAFAWLEQALRNSSDMQRFTLIPAVIAGFLRITTNRKVFPTPTPIEAATRFIDDILNVPNSGLLPSAREWPKLRLLCLQKGLIANSIPDAWIAAQVIDHKQVLATFDSDFAKLLPADNLLLLVN